MNASRVFILVLDACGIGALPDAHLYGDSEASTIPHIAQAVGGMNLLNLQLLGLGNIVSLVNIPPVSNPIANFGRMAERSKGKDSTTGHWELAGITLDNPFPLFPNGFPLPLIQKLESHIGYKTIGNIPASGTAIIASMGEEHLRTSALILYSSADSVLQIAAHEILFPLPKLYDICRKIRELMTGEFAVARVIARPFIGEPGKFIRSSGRKDFSLTPPSDTILDSAIKTNLNVLSIGKIFDLFAGKGISRAIPATNNDEVMNALIKTIHSDTTSHLILANCVDFDMLWGHRNDEIGFARSLEAFDKQLGILLTSLKPDDILFITADHGCDPTIKTSTDHTREYVPILAYGQQLKQGDNLGTRASFADLAATVSDILHLPPIQNGKSFWNLIKA